MNPWAAPSALALMLVVGLGLHLRRQHVPRPLRRPIVASVLGAALYSAGAFGTFVARTPREDWLALLVLYAGLMLVVPCWWLASLRFARLHGMAPGFARHAAAEWGPAALSGAFFVGLASNPWHGLFLEPHLEGRSLFGPGWLVFAVFGYGTILATIHLLGTLAARSPSPSVRRQALWFALGCALPLLGNLSYVLPATPPPFDPTALGIALSTLFFARAIDRGQLFAPGSRMLAELIGADTEPVMVMDASGSLLHANPAACQWLDLEEVRPTPNVPERIAERLTRNAHGEPVDPERLRDGLLASGRELHALFRADPERWLRIHAWPLPDARGRPRLVAVRVRDETPLRRVSEALVEQAATLDAVIAASEDGFLVVDWPAGRLRYVNQAFAQIVGVRALPAVGEDAEAVRQAVHPAVRHPDALDEIIDQGLREPRAVVPFALQTRDGRLVEGSSRGVMRDGRVVARLYQVRDVTEQRRAEDAVRLAQKLDSLSVMAGGIAHDFNNLLVSVLGNTEVALDALPAEAEACAPLRDVEAAARRASELTRQLLAYAGRVQMEPEELDLSRIVRDVLSLVRGGIPRTVRVESALAAAPPAVRGDAGQLRQVALHLIRNATEAVDAGGTVRIETGIVYLGSRAAPAGIAAEVSPSRPLVFLRVSDDGVGMDEETRERIFDPFFSTRTDGRGLGLAATLGIVRSHGGTVQVESAPDEGTSLTVLLPSTGRPASPEAPTAEPAEDGWRSEGCVLVVDDEPGVLRVARRILEAAGFEVDEAEDGVQALERYDADPERYRAVLLDLTMPRLSGEDAWRELRKRAPDLPVLISSGYPQARRRLSETDRVTGFVPKPYTRATLLDALRGLLQGRAGSAPLR